MENTPAYKAYHAMLDKVCAENAHLSESDLHAKLCEARAAYIRKIRKTSS